MAGTCGTCRCRGGVIKSSYDKTCRPWASCSWKKKLAERNGLGCEAKKNQKPSDAPAEEKEKSENPSGGVNSYLLLGIGGLVVSVLGVYYQREAIMTTLRRTPAPGKDVASAPEPKPKPNPAAIFG